MTACTLARAVRVDGIGIHTGVAVVAHLFPADGPDQGVVFQRDGVRIPARPENVAEARRCTVLQRDGVRVSTVEHLLSACAGFGITDLTVEVMGPELPIGDGSAMLWCDALGDAGQTSLPTSRSLPNLSRPFVLAGAAGAFIAAFPAERLSLNVGIHFAHRLVGAQSAVWCEGEDYLREIAPARTFGFWEEVEPLRAAGLARGGTLENAIIVCPDHFSAPLRFENELARHKLLDLVGDLYLAGPLPSAEIVAIKPSHALNVAFAASVSAILSRS